MPLSASTSDKHQWHRFTPVYDAALERLGPVDRIVEFGVLRGDSVRWLRTRYPSASIFGIDILPVMPEWPQDERIDYHKLDQGDEQAVSGMFDQIGDGIDLIIEDGSHFPVHQALCLRAGLPRLRRGGLYILEDIHTSHRSHPLSTRDHNKQANALNVLLAVQHLKETGQDLDERRATTLASDLFFTKDAVTSVFEAIHTVSFFRRASLPLTCWSCGTADFDYVTLRCRCDADLYAEADSMTALVTRG